jgi:hypothetical protein
MADEQDKTLEQELKEYFDEHNANLVDWQLVRKEAWFTPDYSKVVARMQLKSKLDDIDKCISILEHHRFGRELMDYYKSNLDYMKTLDYGKQLEAQAEEEEFHQFMKGAAPPPKAPSLEQTAPAPEQPATETPETDLPAEGDEDNFRPEYTVVEVEEPDIPDGWNADDTVERTFKVTCSVRELLILSEAMNQLGIDYEKLQ